jgi:hypothetical protein
MRSLKRFLESKSFDAKHIEEELQLIITHKHLEVCGFKDIDAYLQAEVGLTHQQLTKRLAQDLAADPNVPPLDTHAEAGAKGGRGNKADSNTTSFIDRGASYLVRRLKRDYPEIAEALARGEIPSARAAGIAAGIVKVPTPLELLRKDWKKASTQERETFRKEIQ